MLTSNNLAALWTLLVRVCVTESLLGGREMEGERVRRATTSRRLAASSRLPIPRRLASRLRARIGASINLPSISISDAAKRRATCSRRIQCAVPYEYPTSWPSRPAPLVCHEQFRSISGLVARNGAGAVCTSSCCSGYSAMSDNFCGLYG
ncbi:hypothetical protein HDK64DRAFT_266919 [Phyllosticta capitalensis]